MELEKAIERCNDFINENKSRPIILHTAIETVIKELENRIPIKRVEDKIKELEELKVPLPVEHMKQAQIKILKDLLEEK